ncbi:hypothetical protein [Aridibaculum aurantiacum]|uniref:hypothetical protein n=1 Tax=Aridibaculum aurantiacum TaxID=2810307 RepID=UPI001A96375C|nr:hypothetical protein [Aridibaculum aurantiacum]
MSYLLTTAQGSLEAVIDDNCGMKKFLNIANTLSDELAINFSNKFDNSDSVDWMFLYKGHLLTLHYNIYNGVSICSDDSKHNDAVNELARLLEQRLY